MMTLVKQHTHLLNTTIYEKKIRENFDMPRTDAKSGKFANCRTQPDSSTDQNAKIQILVNSCEFINKRQSLFENILTQFGPNKKRPFNHEFVAKCIRTK